MAQPTVHDCLTSDADIVQATISGWPVTVPKMRVAEPTFVAIFEPTRVTFPAVVVILPAVRPTLLSFLTAFFPNLSFILYKTRPKKSFALDKPKQTNGSLQKNKESS